MSYLYIRQRHCCWLMVPCDRRVITFLLNLNVLHSTHQWIITAPPQPQCPAHHTPVNHNSSSSASMSCTPHISESQQLIYHQRVAAVTYQTKHAAGGDDSTSNLIRCYTTVRVCRLVIMGFGLVMLSSLSYLMTDGASNNPFIDCLWPESMLTAITVYHGNYRKSALTELKCAALGMIIVVIPR